jgi:hypothetical protein
MLQHFGDLQLLDGLLSMLVASVVTFAVGALLDHKPVWPDADDFGDLTPIY